MVTAMHAYSEQHGSKSRKLIVHVFKCQGKARDSKLSVAQRFEPSKTLCIDILLLARLCLIKLSQTSHPSGEQLLKCPQLWGHYSFNHHL